MPEPTLSTLTAAVRAHADAVAPGSLVASLTIAGSSPGEWTHITFDLSPDPSPSAAPQPAERP